MQRFGQEVEESERNDGSGAEGQDQVQPVLEAQSREPAQKGGAEGTEGDRQNKKGVDDGTPS